ALPSDPPHREPHAIRSFSYGPGDDARPPYGRDARVLTARVDLSGVVPEGWSSRRTSYWGFDPARLPVAGKAWVPLGVSGAPLVLLMHGTHDMRVASEDGLAYLAEALSARGFAAATIDVNFLGYGGRAGELQGSDIQARAALVVAHLEAWHAMVAASASPLHRAVDLQRVLLVGHSRGGEAIALAASLLSNGAARGRYRVRALAALAPTENEGPAWFDASYLTIHGDADNDVEAFVGLRAYHRLRVGSAGGDRGEDRGALVKSAVLVQGANHSQFNEAWGRSDKTWPASLLERRANLLPAWKQRRVTAALVTAFAEAALLGSARGRDVLRDARGVVANDAGVRVKAKYQDAASELLAAFDEDQDPSTGTTDGSKIDAQGFDRWSELDPPLRLPEHFGTRMNRALELMWGRRPRATAPRLTIALPQAAAGDLRAGGSIAFNVAYPAEPPRIEVRVVDAAGLAARVPLDEHFPLEPLRRTRLSILELLERPTAQTLLETASVPLSAFTAREPRLDLGSIRTVELVFRSTSGTVRIDDVQLWRGASPAPGPP
ncbi:MAG TPA: hypothetical protein VFK90_15315, partial [Anaeromyxobacter sp.]|nr:hypothetical protein [Anaeromyxobacter sp.]